MTILITEEGRYLAEGEAPEVGRRYSLEDAISGTSAQNRLFHALITEYWKSGVHPTHGGEPWETIRNVVKRDLGAGFERFKYPVIVDGHAEIMDAKSFDDVPEESKPYCQGVLKSWTNYTKKQRKTTIDNLIQEMISVWVDTPKFNKILEELEREKRHNA